MDNIWREVRKLFHGVDLKILAQKSDRPLSLGVVATSIKDLKEVDEFLVPTYLSTRKAEEARQQLLLFVVPLHPAKRQTLLGCELIVCTEEASKEIENDIPVHFVWHPAKPEAALKEILKERWDLALPLAKHFVPFRRLVQRRWIQSVALENTLFATLAALRDEIPAALQLAKALGIGRDSPSSGLTFDSFFEKWERNHSTAFLTANQMRLAFLIAASSDSEVGFREQRGQITAVAAAALGWRTLARGLEQKMPPRSHLLTRGLLAFLGTYTTGLALEQFHTLSQSLTRDEKNVAYEQAYRLSRRVLDEVFWRMASRARSAA